MEAPWLPMVLDMLGDIPHLCSIVKDLIMDVPVGQVLKCLQSLHFSLWLLRKLCCADECLPKSIMEVVGRTQTSTTKVYQECWKEWAS